MTTEYRKMATFPVEYLTSTILFASKQDVRYYLNGIHINREHLEATDGHRAVRIDFKDNAAVDVFDDMEDMIIPRESVETLLKQLTAGQKKKTTVDLVFNGMFYQLQVLDKMAVFQPIDGRYPDVSRVIPVDDNLDQYAGPLCFNWQYVADVQKSLLLLTGNKATYPIMHPNNNLDSAALFTTKANDFIKWVVMPVNMDKA